MYQITIKVLKIFIVIFKIRDIKFKIYKDIIKEIRILTIKKYNYKHYYIK